MQWNGLIYDDGDDDDDDDDDDLLPRFMFLY